MRGRRLDFTNTIPWQRPLQLEIAGIEPRPAAAMGDHILDKPRELGWRDWAVYLLHSGAEVEHALLVQYLFAAYSIDTAASGPAADGSGEVSAVDWRDTIVEIAIEEMGHLLSVQNILRLLGAPLNLEREDFPLRSDVYPFPFQTEALSQHSLAKYVYAEMPETLTSPDFIQPPFTAEEEAAIASDAQAPPMAGGNQFLNHVGMLYGTLIALFERHAAELEPLASIGELQAHAALPWSRTKDDITTMPLRLRGPRVLAVTSVDEAKMALDFIAQQGEASSTQPGDSHFGRFLKIYRQFPRDLGTWPTPPVLPVSRNPSAFDRDPDSTPIQHETTLLYGLLFNLRYRMLLTFLTHSISIEAYESLAPLRPRKHYQMLVDWIYEEMRDGMLSISELAQQMAGMPLESGAAAPTAGAPFELPYTLSLPPREPDRWRWHQDLIDSAIPLIDSLLAQPDSPEFAEAKSRLPALRADDLERRATIDGIKAEVG